VGELFLVSGGLDLILSLKQEERYIEDGIIIFIQIFPRRGFQVGGENFLANLLLGVIFPPPPF